MNPAGSSIMTELSDPFERLPRPSGHVEAVCEDLELGITERAEFSGPEGRRIFAYRTRPVGGACGGIVICSSLYADFTFNYRREVTLGRFLAARGFAVRRFHYCGTGNSEGDPARVTFDTLVQDARFAAERLLLEERLETVTFLGVRWGGAVAAAAAAAFSAAPLVLWEPVLDAESWFEEGLKAKRSRDVTVGRTASSSGQLRDELERAGSIDLLGNHVHWNFYQSSLRHRLETELGERPDRVLLLLPDRAPRRSRDRYEALVSAWTGRGVEVEVTNVGTSAGWWFFGQRPLLAEETGQQISELVERWLSGKPA